MGKFFLRLLLLVPDVALALHTLPRVAAGLWTSCLSAVFFWDAAYMPPWHSPLDDDTLGTCGRMVSSSQHLTALKHSAGAADLEWMSANQDVSKPRIPFGCMFWCRRYAPSSRPLLVSCDCIFPSVFFHSV